MNPQKKNKHKHNGFQRDGKIVLFMALMDQSKCDKSIITPMKEIQNTSKKQRPTKKTNR